MILRKGTPALAVQILNGNLSRRIGLAEPMAILAIGRGVSLALGATIVQSGAPVTLVISYPGGGEQVIGPTPAPASGRYTYSLRVPASIHGTVKVVAVTGGVVSQASFTVG